MQQGVSYILMVGESLYNLHSPYLMSKKTLYTPRRNSTPKSKSWHEKDTVRGALNNIYISFMSVLNQFYVSPESIVASLQGRRKAFKSEGALALAEGQSPLGGFGGMLPRKILRFDIVRDRI